MLSRFFIDRPVLSVVISVVIVMAGLASVSTLPIAQYPEIAPPTVEVSCVYPGANAVVVQDTIAAPIEQQVNGVENMLYMSSTCSNDGSYKLNVTFKLGTNLDMAQVLVQNRVALALPSLPDVVKTTGVSTKKKSPNILLVVNLYSKIDESTKKPYFDQLYLSNYATIQIRDELSRLEGVGDVGYLGQQDYSMRAWLDVEKMATRGMTASEVIAALREQNVQVAAGQIGQPPIPGKTDFQYTLTTLGRLLDAEQFADIIVRDSTDGRITRLRDVARIELGARNQDTECRMDGQPSVGLPIFQLPGSNALDTAHRIRTKMAQLKTRFPEGLEFAIVYDTTPFIEESVAEVYKTLRDAVILVAIVVLCFLQDWKAMILPMIDVPVSLIGTFAVMVLLGFTLNNLTLFGLVLAIGIVVDDAIVVLENVERWISKGLDSREATIRAMNEITGSIIAITLVLASVFIPSAFISGISGQFYRQFALTIAASTIISAINALTMTPSRCVMIFHTEPGGHHKREALPWWGTALLAGWLTLTLGQMVFGFENAADAHHDAGEQASHAIDYLLWGYRLGCFIPGLIVGALVAGFVNTVLGRFFGIFNRMFDALVVAYGWTVARLIRLSAVVMLVYGGLLFLTYVGIARTPTGFIPSQDKGYLLVSVQLPDSASLSRTSEVMTQAEKIARETPGVAHTVLIAGRSVLLNSNASNFATMFVTLDPFHDRKGKRELTADAVAQKLRGQYFEKIQEAIILVFGAPAVDGLGNAGGFKLMVEDRGDVGLDTLAAQSDNLAFRGNQQPGLVGLFSGFRANTPQLYVDIDRTKCKTLAVPLDNVFITLQAFLGGFYVNDFNRFGRTWQVNLQADGAYRLDADQMKQFRVLSKTGDAVPLGTLLEVRDSAGPVTITRYNLYPASAINGASLPGTSTGQVISMMDRLADAELPRSMSMEWTELSYLQIQEGNSAIYAFVGAVALVFLILASQYESYTLPAAVIMVLPMCLLSAVVGIGIAHMDLNIFVQVGLIVLVGLASKNAILIVEFAKQNEDAGMSTVDAAIHASEMRLRPIIMTSFAFILGVVPLVISEGAGAEMRRTLGTAVFAGMLGVTFFGIFLTPVFFTTVRWLFGESKSTREIPAAEPESKSGEQESPGH